MNVKLDENDLKNVFKMVRIIRWGKRERESYWFYEPERQR